MRKEISYSQFQQVKGAAKLIDKPIREIEALKKKIMPLVAEMKSKQEQVELLEAGIVKVIGFHVADLVKKVIEPTGATGRDGKPIKVTKYLPTDIVSYDEQKKMYIIETPSTEEINAEVEQKLAEEQEAAIINEKTLECEAAEAEAETEGNGMPWENN